MRRSERYAGQHEFQLPHVGAGRQRQQPQADDHLLHERRHAAHDQLRALHRRPQREQHDHAAVFGHQARVSPAICGPAVQLRARMHHLSANQHQLAGDHGHHHARQRQLGHLFSAQRRRMDQLRQSIHAGWVCGGERVDGGLHRDGALRQRHQPDDLHVPGRPDFSQPPKRRSHGRHRCHRSHSHPGSLLVLWLQLHRRHPRRFQPHQSLHWASEPHQHGGFTL